MHVWGTGRKVEKHIRVEKGNSNLPTSIFTDRILSQFLNSILSFIK